MKTLLHTITILCAVATCFYWWYCTSEYALTHEVGYPVILLCYYCVVRAINDKGVKNVN